MARQPGKPGSFSIPAVGWMAQLASTHRAKTSEEIKYISKSFAKALRISWRDYPASRQGPYLKPELMEIFLKACWDECQEKLGFSPEQCLETIRLTINSAYGNPSFMQQNGLKAHAVPYWNPTGHKVNIHPMGLLKSLDEKTREAVFYTVVEPGEHVMIPHAYTVGGKHSTVHGVAPQLRPLPRQLETVLDITPFTYSEWCTFNDPSVSNCHRHPVAWHDDMACPVCTKCGKPCMGNRF